MAFVLPKGKALAYVNAPAAGDPGVVHEFDLLVSEHMVSSFMNMMREHSNAVLVQVQMHNGDVLKFQRGNGLEIDPSEVEDPNG